MILYLDTSALVKLYVEEDNSDKVLGWVADAGEIWTCMVTFSEARAALGRRHRERSITKDAHDQALEGLDQDWPHLNTLIIDQRLTRAGGLLATRFGLRGFDALHLATALRATMVAGPLKVAVYDQGLKAAMSKAGLTVLV